MNLSGMSTLAGYTKEQAVKYIGPRELSVYTRSTGPEISLKISGYNSKIVYVVGEVAPSVEGSLCMGIPLQSAMHYWKQGYL